MLQLNSAVHARTRLAEPETRDASAPARGRVGDVQFTVTSDLAALAGEWRRFEQHADCTVFQCYDWLSAWQRHVGERAGVLPAIVVGRRGGEIVCILPLAVQRRTGVRQLCFLGRELGDYNAPLLAADFTSAHGGDFPALWHAIRASLQADPQYRHDVILLDKMPAQVGAQPNPFLQLAVKLNPSGAYAVRLEGDWETFYAAKRSSATRRRDRTKRKKLAESGDVRMITPATAGDIALTLDALFRQKSKAFARMGVEDVFARPGYREFFHELATGERTRQLAHVSRLQVDSTFAATNFGLRFRGTYSHLIASYDDGPLSRFGPGAAHLHDLMRHAIEHGCTVFDFTIGDEPYKRDWSDSEIELYDHVAAATARGAAVAGTLAALRATKRALKHSSLIWPLIVRLRAMRASLRKRPEPARGQDSEP